MKAVYTVKNLTVKYGNSEVFKDINFSILKGDYLTIVGPNGSGKSTLIKALLKLVPFLGEIEIFDIPLKDFQDWYKIGYIPQRSIYFNPYFPATVKEVVSMGLLSKKKYGFFERRKDLSKIDRALKSIGIYEIKDNPVFSLSGGQQQRVLIARALVNEPEILILDEPTGALDPDTRETFFEILTKLNKEGKTIVLVTHDIGSAGKYATKLMYFDRGIIFHGTFKEFCESESMGGYFGQLTQHLICHRDDKCIYRLKKFEGK